MTAQGQGKSSGAAFVPNSKPKKRWTTAPSVGFGNFASFGSPKGRAVAVVHSQEKG